MQSFKLRTDVTIGALIHIGVLSTEAEFTFFLKYKDATRNQA